MAGATALAGGTTTAGIITTMGTVGHTTTATDTRTRTATMDTAQGITRLEWSSGLAVAGTAVTAGKRGVGLKARAQEPGPSPRPGALPSASGSVIVHP